MPNIKICRICLNTESKLYEYDLYKLKEYYEQVMATKVDEKEGLPCHFCYECAAMLHKFHKFKEKCYNGLRVLRHIMKYKGPIAIASFHQLRDVEDLQSSLGIIAINKTTNRVKTYLVKAKEIPELVVKPGLETASLSDTDEDKFDEEDENPLFIDHTDFEKMIDDDNAINVYDAKIDITDANNALDDEMIKHDEVSINDHDFDEGKVNNDDDSSICEIEENVFADGLKLSDDEVCADKETIEKKNINTKDSRQKKKFERKKTELDPKNWLKIILNEEEVVAEFKARSTHDRYVCAKYKCTLCFKSFSKEDMLVRHLKFCHSESLGALECRFCHMRFKMKFKLKKHMRQHYNKFQCLRCDLICPLEDTARFHDQYHNGVIRKCPHCEREFNHVTSYYSHLRTHRSEYVCPVCGESFVSTVGLEQHKRIKHFSLAESETAPVTSKSEEVFCARCDIRFSTRKAYEEHLIQSALHVDSIEDQVIQTSLRKNKPSRPKLRRIPTDCYLPASVASHLNTHTKEKLYTCGTCHKEFNSKTGLNKHQLRHSNVKAVACTLCDKRFKEKCSMKLHYRTFHLKEPYPKRNRRKKFEDSKLEADQQDDSDDNLTLDKIASVQL